MKHRSRNRRRRDGLAQRLTCGACVVALLAAQSSPAIAGSYEQARRIYERLAGVPPSATVLNMMQSAIQSQGQAGLLAAAKIATDPTYAPSFYNVTLKEFVNPWTNRDQSAFVPLNDYTATVVGMVRDDVPFNTVLSADILYVFSNVSGLPAPSPANDDHYSQAEAMGISMADKSKFVRTTQSSVYGLPVAAVSGVWTTRAGAQAFFINGTNRAQFRFTMLNYLCHDMQTVMDNTRPTDRIRQDVSRSPGGDSRVFLNNCAGCHSGMDPMAQAFAYYDFSTTTNQLVYTAGQVQPKYLKNPQNFPWGFVTPDDSWSNRWRQGPNADLGWDPNLPGSGKGAASLGEELENTEAFANCQVVKVFQAVCLRAPTSQADQATVSSLEQLFKSSDYDLKQVFQQSAADCAGS